MSRSNPQVGAGAIGITGGTIIVLLANDLLEAHGARQALLLAAPSLGVALSAVWLWLQTRVANYVLDKEAQSTFRKGKETLQLALAQPNISLEHRQFLTKKLEELDKMMVDRHMDRIAMLKVLTIRDLRDLQKRSEREGQEEEEGQGQGAW